MHITAAVLSAALVSVCAGLSIPRDAKYVVHEKRDAQFTSPALAKRSKIDSSSLLPMRIGLTQSEMDKAYDYLMDVSSPESKNFGKHWTPAQVNTAFAPSAETVQAVRNWLIKAGISGERITVSDNKGWLAFDANVEEAEELFRAQYFEHEHASDSAKITVGCDEYSLPDHITPHIDFITPGVKHNVYKRREVKKLQKRGGRSNIIAPPPPTPGGPDVNIDIKTVPRNCSSYVTDGDCLRALYQLPAQDSTRKVSSTNTLGIWESGENYDKSDLKEWFQRVGQYIPASTIPEMSSVDGGEGPVSKANAGVEALLDITIAYELIYPQQVNIFSADDAYSASHYAGFMDTTLDAIDASFCTYSAFGQKGDNTTVDPTYPDPHAGGYKGPLMCGEYAPPKILSVSYTDGEQLLPVNYIERQCNEYLKLGLQGTTVVFASGDYGVSAYPGTYGTATGCIRDPSGKDTIFSPAVWDSCPYVLSVGATTIMPNVSGYSSNPEMAVYQTYSSGYPFTSGAGFSNIFKRPTYQDNAVNTYFDNYNPGYPTYTTSKGKNIGTNGGIINRAGRAYPDVSANGAWTYLYASGELIREGGTSMAAPLVASILNLINEERMKIGKSTVGFVHPTLYGNPQAFHDITVGSNQGCGYDHAFNATVGWDPVTGLGTPNYNELHKIYMQLP